MIKKELIAKEKLIVDLENNLIDEFIKLRKGKNITQGDLAESSRVIRQTVNRIENCLTSPQLGTMLKLLEPLGYTLKIVPLKKMRGDEKNE